jgi:hypothetical protein
MRLFGGKYVGSVIKLFKIMEKKGMDLGMDLYETSNKIVQKYTNDRLNKVNLNLRHNDWSINKLYNHIKSTNEKIDVIEAFGRSSSDWSSTFLVYMLYNENLLEKSFLELILTFDMYLINDVNIVIDISNEYLKVIHFDYGYIFDRKWNQDIDTERKSFFGTYSSHKKEDVELERKIPLIKEGFIPKMYKYNILNENQIKTLNEKIL